MRARGFIVLLPGLSWLTFTIWKAEQISGMAKTNPINLEGQMPLRYAVLS
jgi:hypothetical protein